VEEALLGRSDAENLGGEGLTIEPELRAFHEACDYEKLVNLAIASYGQELLRYSLGLLRSRQDADEVFSQTCLDIWGGLEKFKWKSTFRTWAYAICHNNCVRHLREKQKWRMARLDEVPQISKLVARVRTSTKPYLLTDLKSRVSILREKLTLEDQALLNLRIDRGMSWQDVALVMLGNKDDHDQDTIERESRACRKRFERTKAKLKKLADAAGLLD